MKLPHKIEPQAQVSVDGNNIAVSSLPLEIQNEIRTWERFYQEYVDAVYNLEKADIILKAKREQVEGLLRDHVKTLETQRNAPEKD